MNFNDICEYDDGLLFKKGTKHVYGYVDMYGYIQVHINHKTYRAHRVIWEMLKGTIPEGYVIDHIDGNRCNNRIANLRLATPAQNNANSKGSSAKCPKGVKAHKGKFQARIGYRGVQYHIGSFTTPELAKEAYDAKALELYNEFAKA